MMHGLERLHVEVTCPSRWQEQVSKLPDYYFLSYSRHALSRARERGLRLPREVYLKGSPERLTGAPAKVIEVTRTSNGKLRKALVRLDYGNYFLCLSVTPSGHVVTCYANSKDDSHATLVKSRYVP